MKGFSMVLLNTKFGVQFKTHNEKVVYCNIFCDTRKYQKGKNPKNPFLFDLDGKTFTGMALCHPTDKFSLEEGQRLAYQRAMAKLNKKLESIIRAYERHVLYLNKSSAFITDNLNRKFLKKIEEKPKAKKSPKAS